MKYKGFSIFPQREYLSGLSIDESVLQNYSDKIVYVYEGDKYIGAFESAAAAKGFIDQLLEIRTARDSAAALFVQYRKNLSEEIRQQIDKAGKIRRSVRRKLGFSDFDQGGGGFDQK